MSSGKSVLERVGSNAELKQLDVNELQEHKERIESLLPAPVAPQPNTGHPALLQSQQGPVNSSPISDAIMTLVDELRDIKLLLTELVSHTR